VVVPSLGFVVLLLLALAGPLVGLLGLPGRAAAAAVPRPNIVVIMTDDQRPGTLETMPTVQAQLRQLGERFDGVVPTALCAPSRVSFLTGKFAHTTGVYANGGATGGWPAFHASGYEDHTVATALEGAGYRTGLVGKYLNYWGQAPAGFVPPGWDVFRAIDSSRGQGAGAYYNYLLRGTGPTETFGSATQDYSTDVLAQRAEDFVTSTPSDQPLFLMFTPSAPHSPFTPAPRDEQLLLKTPWVRDPAMNEADMRDKPAFMQNRPAVRRAAITRMHNRTLRTLAAVDDAVAGIISALGTRAENTLFVFTSDNGYLWGEHRLVGKDRPYEWSSGVPLIMRWDGHIAPGSNGGLAAANIDVTATILEAAGATAGLDVEGQSVLTTNRRGLLLEGTATGRFPAYCGWRTHRESFVENSDGLGRELYDFSSDPYELVNVASRSRELDTVSKLRAQARLACSPVPPGFAW